VEQLTLKVSEVTTTEFKEANMMSWRNIESVEIVAEHHIHIIPETVPGACICGIEDTLLVKPSFHLFPGGLIYVLRGFGSINEHKVPVICFPLVGVRTINND